MLRAAVQGLEEKSESGTTRISRKVEIRKKIQKSNRV